MFCYAQKRIRARQEKKCMHFNKKVEIKKDEMLRIKLKRKFENKVSDVTRA